MGKTAVAGIKDRKTKKVVARVVPNTKATTLQPLIRQHVRPGPKAYTDDFPSYRGLQDFEQDSVKHSVGEYMRGIDVHTNGISTASRRLSPGASSGRTIRCLRSACTGTRPSSSTGRTRERTTLWIRWKP